MFKTKLFAGICAGASVVTAAATALTLIISGPSGEKSLHQYSANEQVEISLERAFNSVSTSSDQITEFVNVITSNKTAANVGFTINSADGYEELTGVGGEIEVQLDTESMSAALLFNAALDSVTIVDGTVYVDRNEFLAVAPALYDGIIKANLDNLEEDLTNSFFGQYLLDSMDVDFDELSQAFELVLSDYEKYAPNFQFDSDKFYAGLNETLTKSYNNVLASMELEDLGNQPLNGGSYQCYTVTISIEDLSLILKDAIIYTLNSPEIQSLADQLIEYLSETADIPASDLYMMSGEMLAQYPELVNLYWGQIIGSVEETLGENISFKMYIADTVELAGLQLNMYVDGDTFSFDEKNANTNEYMTITYDLTGGKNLGDYIEFDLTAVAEGSTMNMNYTSKFEPNGDFTMALKAEADDDGSFAMTAEGNYVQDGQFFNLEVDSLKLIEDDVTLYDFGFKCGFKPIDSVTKPTGSPVYDVWEMDEYDFQGLITNIELHLQELAEFFE